MSREIKVCNVNTLNDVNDRVRTLQHTVTNEIARVQRVALEAARDEADRRIRQVRYEMNDTLDQHREYVNRRLQALDESQRQSMRNLANTMYDRMADMNKRLTTRMDRQFDSLRSDMSKMQDYAQLTRQWAEQNMAILNDNITELTREVDARFQQQQTAISGLRNDVALLFDDIRRRQNARNEALQTVDELMANVNRRIDLSRFAAERWHEITTRQRALTTLTDDSAIIAQANEICIQTMLAEEEAWKNKLKIDALVQVASAQLRKVLETVNANRTVEAVHPDNPEDKATVETNFWSRGEYQQVIDELEDISRRLQDPYAKDVTPEQLQQWTARIAELEQQASALVMQAVERAILSENRVVVTEDIVTALIAQGYEVVMENGQEAINYLGGERDNDWREGVYAMMEKGTGERITIIVQPNDDATANQLIFHRNDQRNITEAEYMASIERIRQEIAKSGHPVGQVQPPASGSDRKMPELTTASGMSKKGTAQKIKQQIRG